ncbi:peptidoglycan DD-metalloendopeptidase family protein [Luteipulveratus halotolerans]|uniref:Peptidase M23 n=1 Tax=Luteipulveratus halotolerans TaxID=1631356 RepID=A0A0L6CKD6_9MICO|nr:peptidoglycan DD-metalloendopeptidase family protein [Luteipulveratus halotolerans]KNX38266.1 peptidase M23 [Luteipulveratus halotolerans]
MKKPSPSRNASFALVPLVTLGLATAAFVAPTSAEAAARDGVCDSGEFCLYYNSDNAGSVSDFAGSIPDYGATQPECYEFKSAGAGQGLCVKNNAASVWNRTGTKVRVYYNSGYAGASQDFAAGTKGNLNTTLKNNNASHQLNPGTTGVFRLPFPCGEVWAAQTRSNHSPANAVDFNHYPDDLGWKVYAAAPGKVSRVADLGGTSYGKYIVIDHAGGWQTLYAHLQSQNVSVGQTVSDTTFIGRVGSTGGSTGPHLHFEEKLSGVVKRSTFADGSPVYPDSTVNLSRKTHCPAV